VQHPTPEQLDEMARLGRLRFPQETGGVLHNGRLIEMPNRATPVDAVDSYLITVEDIFDAVGGATTEEVLFWHTHPGGMIGPSSVDLGSQIEGFQYMVVTVFPTDYVATRYGEKRRDAQEAKRVRGSGSHTNGPSAEGAGRSDRRRQASTDLLDGARLGS
jgi:proteasome lid subunit RPN8/RPN11